MNAIFAGASRMDGISAFKRLSVRSSTKKLGHYWICRLPGPRPIAHAAAQRRPDQTALSEPHVRFEAHCRLNSDIASCPKSAMSGSGFSLIGSLPGFETAMLMKRAVGVIEPSSSPR